MKRDLEGQLAQQLSKVAGEIAREGQLKAVLVKGPVWFGGLDITQQVIDRLK